MIDSKTYPLPALQTDHTTIYVGDCLDWLAALPSQSVDCIVTSPPYWGLRSYGSPAEIGGESAVTAYIARLGTLADALARVLSPMGTCWLNLGDTFASDSKGSGGFGKHGISSRQVAAQQFGARKLDCCVASGNLMGIPWRVALEWQRRGWFLRSEIIWHKPNVKPENVKNRPTRDHETIFLLTRRASGYHYDQDAIREPCVSGPGGACFGKVNCSSESERAGAKTRRCTKADRLRYIERGRNKRTVWRVPTKSYRGAHFATFPETLIEPCILAGCPEGGTVLDPFIGSGTVAAVAQRLGRNCIGIELQPSYLPLIGQRLGIPSEAN